MSDGKHIGAVATATGLSIRTIRYYEEAGLLRPERSQGGFRLYGDADLARLARIGDLKAAGLDLEQIRAVLGAMDDLEAGASDDAGTRDEARRVVDEAVTHAQAERRRLHERIARCDALIGALRGEEAPAEHSDPSLDEIRLRLRSLQEILDGIGAHVYTKDAQSRYTYANAATRALFGRSLDEIIGQPDEAFFSPDMAEAVRANDAVTLERGEMTANEEAGVDVEGRDRTYWAVKTPMRDDAGRIVGICGVSTDITDRKALERAVQDQRRLLETVLDNADASIYMKDLDRRLLYVNREWAELFGTTPDDAQGRLEAEVVPAEFAERFSALDQVVIDGRRRHVAEESGVFDGRLRHFWSVKAPIFDDDGRVIGVCGVSTDITDRKELEHELIEQRALLDTVLDNAGAYIYMKDRDRRMRYVNRHWAGLFGRTPDEVIGRREPEITGQEASDVFWEADRIVLDSQEIRTLEETATMPDGSERHYWSVKVPLGHLGHPDRLIGFSTDITELQRLRKELEHQAFTDSLTGVSARGHFMTQAERQIVQARRYNRPLSFALLDLDHFKTVNDTHGHAAGDAVLAAVAQACEGAIRHADLIGRVGGEEFALVLTETDLRSAIVLGERLCQLVRSLCVPVLDATQGVEPTISVGVTQLRDEHTGDEILERLMAEADAALYAAKAAGRDRVHAYTPSSDG